MNTAKQINVMIGLLFVGLLGTFLYFLFDNGFSIAGFEFEGREKIAQQRQLMTNVERGALLYSRNCRSCHGLTGEGRIERSDLPGAPLNIESNYPPVLTTTEATGRKARITATIHCGRVGTVMPPWSTEEGGSLNDFQIQQLVMLITSEFAPEGWEVAVEESNHGDVLTPKAHLVEAIGPDDEEIVLNDAAGVPAEGTLRIGGDTLEEPYEVLNIVEVDAETNTVTVERAFMNTDALDHEAAAEVYNGPIAPGDVVTGAAGIPPCGQKAAGATPAAAEEVPLADAAEIDMGDNFFAVGDAQNPILTAAAGDSVEITLTNIGSAIHNLVFSGPDGELETDDDVKSDPETIAGGETGTIAISVEEAGTYLYHCEFHPVDMSGEIVVE